MFRASSIEPMGQELDRLLIGPIHHGLERLDAMYDGLERLAPVFASGYIARVCKSCSIHMPPSVVNTGGSATKVQHV